MWKFVCCMGVNPVVITLSGHGHLGNGRYPRSGADP